MASSISPLLIIGAGYLLYASGALKSLTGGLGQTSQTQTTPSQTPAGGTGATTTQPAASRSCAMVPGVQYVAPKGGGFVVVIGGREVGQFDDLASAEREYNRLLGC